MVLVHDYLVNFTYYWFFLLKLYETKCGRGHYRQLHPIFIPMCLLQLLMESPSQRHIIASVVENL
jgi:hypothetical protein